MDPCLLRNGVNYCDVIGAGGLVHENGSLALITNKRVLSLPGDVFEFASKDVRFPVVILHSRVGLNGWDTVCTIRTDSPPDGTEPS